MRWIVTGSGGQLGRCLVRQLRADPDVADPSASARRDFVPRLAGFYAIDAAPPPDAVVASSGGAVRKRERQWFSFRRSSSESDLRALGETGLRNAMEPLGVTYAIGNEVEIDAFRRQQEGEVWRWMALGAGIFLVLELLAAWWFGRRP